MGSSFDDRLEPRRPRGVCAPYGPRSVCKCFERGGQVRRNKIIAPAFGRICNRDFGDEVMYSGSSSRKATSAKSCLASAPASTWMSSRRTSASWTGPARTHLCTCDRAISAVATSSIRLSTAAASSPCPRRRVAKLRRDVAFHGGSNTSLSARSPSSGAYDLVGSVSPTAVAARPWQAPGYGNMTRSFRFARNTSSSEVLCRS